MDNAIPVRRRYPFIAPRDLHAAQSRRLRVLIAGGGPVGLTAALDLGRRGYDVIVLNKLDIVADGSKAICFSKRTLDIYSRLGLADRIIDAGVAWDVGKVFRGGAREPIYAFTMQQAPHQKSPSFVNLQQFYLEEFLLETLDALPNVDVRWKSEVVAVQPLADGVCVKVVTPDGAYTLETEYLLACDGNKSPIRTMLGLDFEGRIFEDNFLIADVRFEQQRPAERWFWFNPPFPGDSALLHKQPDGVWRLDFQLGHNIDRAAAIRPDNVRPFVEGLIGKDTRYEFEWISFYTFQCRRMARFVHDRVIFAGDAAHLVSPFGARGANSGIADIDNLIWKLDLVLQNKAPAVLLESYDTEATYAADVNIMNSTRSTEFITPKSEISRAHRDAILDLAQTQPFARPFVNSGRLAVAVAFPASPLSTPDAQAWADGVPPGAPALDAPIDANGAWLLDQLGGAFALLAFDPDEQTRRQLAAFVAPRHPVTAVLIGQGGFSAADNIPRARYGARPGSIYLIRPDQYVAARWRRFDTATITAALKRAMGFHGPRGPSDAA